MSAGSTETLAGPERTLKVVLDVLDEMKAEDVTQFNLRGRSEVGDYMVIATGRSSRQIAAMADELTETLKRSHSVPCLIEGKAAGDWVLIDTGDVIVHLFRPEVRDFYQLEKLWMPDEEASR